MITKMLIIAIYWYCALDGISDLGEGKVEASYVIFVVGFAVIITLGLITGI